MGKNKTTYAAKSFIEIFLSIWPLIILGLPFCSVEIAGFPLKMQPINGYFFYSLIEPKTTVTQDMQIFTIVSVVLFSIIITISIIGMFLIIINFYLNEHPIANSCSILATFNCFSTLIYMIASIVFVVIINNTGETIAETHAYIYFLVSLIILITYYITPVLIRNNYKKSELKEKNSKHKIHTMQGITSVQSKQNSNTTTKTNLNLFNELLKYKELLDNEILTQEEFDKIKLKLFELN